MAATCTLRLFSGGCEMFRNSLEGSPLSLVLIVTFVHLTNAMGSLVFLCLVFLARQWHYSIASSDTRDESDPHVQVQAELCHQLIVGVVSDFVCLCVWVPPSNDKGWRSRVEAGGPSASLLWCPPCSKRVTLENTFHLVLNECQRLLAYLGFLFDSNNPFEGFCELVGHVLFEAPRRSPAPPLTGVRHETSPGWHQGQAPRALDVGVQVCLASKGSCPQGWVPRTWSPIR